MEGRRFGNSGENGERRRQMLRVHQSFFDAILSGTKTAELRPARNSYAEIKVGDEVQFVSNQSGESVIMCITGVERYEDLDDVLARADISAIAPGMSPEQAESTAGQMFKRAMKEPGFSGFFVFHFERIDQ